MSNRLQVPLVQAGVGGNSTPQQITNVTNITQGGLDYTASGDLTGTTPGPLFLIDQAGIAAGNYGVDTISYPLFTVDQQGRIILVSVSLFTNIPITGSDISGTLGNASVDTMHPFLLMGA